MESAKEDEVLALEDAKDALVPASTALVQARGPPTSYGPQRRGENLPERGREMVRRWCRSTRSGVSGCKRRLG